MVQNVPLTGLFPPVRGLLEKRLNKLGCVTIATPAILVMITTVLFVSVSLRLCGWSPVSTLTIGSATPTNYTLGCCCEIPVPSHLAFLGLSHWHTSLALWSLPHGTRFIIFSTSFNRCGAAKGRLILQYGSSLMYPFSSAIALISSFTSSGA